MITFLLMMTLALDKSARTNIFGGRWFHFNEINSLFISNIMSLFENYLKCLYFFNRFKSNRVKKIKTRAFRLKGFLVLFNFVNLVYLTNFVLVKLAIFFFY